jgi:hypothetical protein
MNGHSTDPSTDPSGGFPAPSLTDNDLEQLLELLKVGAMLDASLRCDLLNVARSVACG